MTEVVTLEIVGYKDSECSPFPCDEDRSCGLSSCAPTGELTTAFSALMEEVLKEFGSQVTMKLTLLDENVPDYIKDLYETHHPAIPMILINGKISPIGRINWPKIRDAILQELNNKN